MVHSLTLQPPDQLTGPSAWIGSDLQNKPERWLYTLNPEQIAELESAAKHFLSLGLDITRITAQNFPLAHFKNHLDWLTQQLLHGLGFEVIRGLPIDQYSTDFAATIFCGIGAHLGSARSQNAAGHILGHVKDLGKSSADPNTRIYQTSERQSFHTDSADVVGLICIQEAKEGGDSLLVSAESIYNRMRQQHPDLLPLLFDPIASDRRGEVPEGALPWMTIPPLSWYDNRLTVFYQRQYIDSAQRFEDAPRLTPQHVEALNAFDALANDPSLHLRMRLQRGDMQFVYNHSQLHDRTGFTDWAEPQKKRHLLRLWLSIQGDRKLPECFKQRYGSIEIGNRGGIVVRTAPSSA